MTSYEIDIQLQPSTFNIDLVTPFITVGGGGVTVHNETTDRDAADAHPQSAITGLVDDLAAIAAQAVLEGNTIVINPDEPESVGKSYNTYAAAVDFCQTQNPSSINRWTIKLPSGDVSEDITLYAHIRVQGVAGTNIIGALTTDVAFTGTEYFDAYIRGCTMNNFIGGTGKIISMFCCVVTGGTPASNCICLIYKSNFVTPLDFSGAASLRFFRNDFANLGGSGLYKFNNGNINQCTVDDCILSGNTDASGTAFDDVTNDGELNLYNSIIKGDFTNNGTLINKGAYYDNRNSALIATEVQGVIDELATGLAGKVSEAPINGVLYARINGMWNKIVHNETTGRDAADAHPQSAITGLISDLGDKQDKPIVSSITIPAADWVADEQTVTVTGVTADNEVDVIIETQANGDLWADANIYVISQGVDTLTFTCETTPTDDIQIKVRIWL